MDFKINIKRSKKDRRNSTKIKIHACAKIMSPEPINLMRWYF